MKLRWLLPVSRRRHERVCEEARDAHREAERLGKAMSAARRERDLASQAVDVLQSRAVRFERAIREHRFKMRSRTYPSPTVDDGKLWSALDDDSQERPHAV